MLKNKMFLPRFYCKSVNATHYVTTPIFYVNASPHIGHLYSAVIADAICRYQRLLYPDRANNIRLCTGTDEHGTKIQQACVLHNTPVAKYCDLVSDKFRSVFQKGFVQYTDFVRTTEERHINVVRHFWQTLRNSGDIYMSEYRGWYCVADETFLTESQVRLDGTSSIRYSLESNQPVEWTEEQNYMFRLSKYQSDILYWLKQENRVRPLKFEKILLDLLAEPLPDISISRPAKRVHWAIPVPDDSSQTIYVWLDALINYLTATGYPDKNFALWWPPKVQVIGKDILKFHGIYWPAFLIAAGLEPPRQLFVHSHWIVDGQKMSKSKNNVVDPQMVSEVFTMEALRYFLLREGTAHSDSNYSSVKAMRIINAELADTLGNLLSRVCAASLNPRQIYPRLHTAQLRDIVSTESGHKLRNVVEQLEAKCTQHYNENNFYLAADYIMLTLHAANSFFEYSRPWELKLKTSSEDVTKRCNLPMPQSNENGLRLETIIAVTMDTLRVCGIALQPLLPQLSARLLDKLSVPYSERMWCNLSNHFIQVVEGKQDPPLEVSLSRTNTVLFKRLTFKTDDKVPLKEHSVNTTTTTTATTTTTNSTDSTKKKSKKLVS